MTAVDPHVSAQTGQVPTGAPASLRDVLAAYVGLTKPRIIELLLRASGNPMFAGLSDVVEEVLRGRTDHHLMPAEPKPEARRLHQMVADAVAAQDPEVARAAMSAICAEVVSELGRTR